MLKHFTRVIIVCAVLFVSFLVTMALCDIIAKYSGYYVEGIEESNALHY